jgi:hypothetical protein
MLIKVAGTLLAAGCALQIALAQRLRRFNRVCGVSCPDLLPLEEHANGERRAGPQSSSRGDRRGYGFGANPEEGTVEYPRLGVLTHPA